MRILESDSRKLLWLFSLALAATLVFCLPVIGGLETVAGLFEAGDYRGAADALETGGQGARPAEESLWTSRLAEDPEEALIILRGIREDKHADREVRLRVALEISDLEYGLSRYPAALESLMPLYETDGTTLPGAVHLRAGLCLRALGDLQRAREMLASVRPDDPAFFMARFYLGDIGLELKDPTLARRYFESAASASPVGERDPRLAAGMWRSYYNEGDRDEAQALLDQLEKDDPGSLSMLEIRRTLLQASDEQIARSTTAADPDTILARPDDLQDRYTLQLGAFSDRGLALEFQRRYRTAVPDLRIDRVRDERGQFLYKVRTGSFVNPALARTEARSLASKLGAEVFVVDLSTQPGSLR